MSDFEKLDIEEGGRPQVELPTNVDGGNTVPEPPDWLKADAERIDAGRIALRGAGKLSEVMGPERFAEYTKLTQRNRSANARWAGNMYGGTFRA